MDQDTLFISTVGDFNVRSFSWWKNDLTTNEGSQADALISSLSKLICEPIHILPNSSTCVDLIFINQSNYMLTLDSGFHFFLHPNCHLK